MSDIKFLSLEEINTILGIIGNHQYRSQTGEFVVPMTEIIDVMYLFENKRKTEKECQEYLDYIESLKR